MAYGCHEERYPLPIDAVDTHRPNPKKAGPSGPNADGALSPDTAKVETARDYFGKAGTGTDKTPATGAERDALQVSSGGVHAGDVAQALEKGLETGDLTRTPKAEAKEEPSV
jgi:6-phosphofructo-2-kinase/fructose-2,6-biphosphatase 2